MRLFPSALVTLSSLLPFQFCAAGVGQFAAIAGSGVPPAPKLWFGPPFAPSEARGVIHIAPANSSARRVKSLLPAALFPF